MYVRNLKSIQDHYLSYPKLRRLEIPTLSKGNIVLPFLSQKILDITAVIYLKNLFHTKKFDIRVYNPLETFQIKSPLSRFWLIRS